MLIVMPTDNAAFAAFEKNFGAVEFAATISSLKAVQVEFVFPKFTFEWGSNSLKENLKNLGMKEVFDSDRNHFPRLLEQNGKAVDRIVFIDEVFHKAKILVDEKGTEAAAATAIVVSRKKVIQNLGQI